MPVTERGSPAVASVSGAGMPSVTLTGVQQPQTGDWLLIRHGNDYYQLSDMTAPTVNGSTTGVVEVTGTGLPADGGQFFAHARVWKYFVASGGSDLTVAAVEGGVADEEKYIAVRVLVGADGSDCIDIAAGAFNSTGSTNHTAPDVAPATAGYLICDSNDGNGSNGAPFGSPGSMTEQYDASVGGAMGYVGAIEQLAAPGSTGTRTFTGGNTTYAATSIVIKAAASATAALSGGQPLPPHLLYQLAARNQAIWQAGASTTQVDAQTGQAATATATYATAVKVAPVTGRCAAAAFSRGAAAKTTAQTGTAAGASTPTATAKKVAPQAGPAATATRTSGTAVKAAPGTGSTAAVATTSGNLGSRAETGRTYAAGAGTATAVKVASVAGRCATAAVARAAAVKRATPSAVNLTATASRAAAVKRATPTGPTLLAAASSGANVKRATATGRTFAVAVALQVSTTRNVIGYVWTATASFPRPNPSDRPSTGTTDRPESGGLLRPYSGVIHRP